MLFWKKIKSKLLGKPYFQLKTEHKIVPAFICDGVQYYQFEDIFALASGRAFVANAFYNELSMRCSREYLLAHTTAVDNILNDKKNIKITELARLNMFLKERLELIVEGEIIMKLASVVFFDENEKPYEYNYKYNLKKIAKWKENKLDAFFLSQQLKNYNPFSSMSEEDFQAYTTIGEKVTDKQISVLSSLLLDEQKKTDFYRILDLQKQVTSA